MNTNESPSQASGANQIARTNYKRLDFKEVKQVANGHWLQILTSLGMPSHLLRRKHGPCPCCGGKDRFRFDNKNDDGTFFCSHCGAGDGFKLLALYRGIEITYSLNLVADYLGLSGKPCLPAMPISRAVNVGTSNRQANGEQLRILNRFWSEARSVASGDPIHKYLTKTRELKLDDIPACLRYHPELDYFDGDNCLGTFPSMLALVMSSDNQPVCLHRTYLTLDGQKAPVAKPKKLMKPIYEGATRGGAIRLQEASESLGIAEGIETALACHITTGLPVWSTVSAGGMASLEVPETVKQVMIFADHDMNNVGLAAAQKLATRLLYAHKKVKLLLPPRAGTDWFDYVMSNEVAS
ncbi:MAG: toprim domain-containing protein [Candidatus Obscuribacterales bacterium]|nr:toprim domain-containing protein [Candidatus Obscuribacterales bacterium]